MDKKRPCSAHYYFQSSEFSRINRKVSAISYRIETIEAKEGNDRKDWEVECKNRHIRLDTNTLRYTMVRYNKDRATDMPAYQKPIRSLLNVSCYG